MEVLLMPNRTFCSPDAAALVAGFAAAPPLALVAGLALVFAAALGLAAALVPPVDAGAAALPHPASISPAATSGITLRSINRSPNRVLDALGYSSDLRGLKRTW